MPRPSLEFPKPRDLGPRDWGVESLLFQNEHYIGKALLMRAGTAGGLQYHEKKVETFILIQGSAFVDYDDGAGNLVSRDLIPSEIVHAPAGATHRVRAVSECIFYEWSTPVFNDRVRCEAEYGQPEVGGLPTSVPDATGHS
jgi:mannose-6-phosphate isomerase-like protein (cupin superfamily)